MVTIAIKQVEILLPLAFFFFATLTVYHTFWEVRMIQICMSQVLRGLKHYYRRTIQFLVNSKGSGRVCFLNPT